MLASLLQAEYADKPAEWFDANPPVRLHVAGRMMFQRIMGKASFAKLQDRTGLIQIFLQRDTLGAAYEAFKKYDVGDILAATGTLFKTKTGELSVRVEELRMLTKSLRPLPDKWQGLADVDTRYRQRYGTHRQRAESQRSSDCTILKYLRDTSIRWTPRSRNDAANHSGSRRRDHQTHHNALALNMFLRIARNSSSSGSWWAVSSVCTRSIEISAMKACRRGATPSSPCSSCPSPTPTTRTSSPWWSAPCRASRTLSSQRQFEYQGRAYDLDKPFTRLTILEAVAANTPGFDVSRARDLAYLRELCDCWPQVQARGRRRQAAAELFEKYAEHTFMDPTFVYAYPTE